MASVHICARLGTAIVFFLALCDASSTEKIFIEICDHPDDVSHGTGGSGSEFTFFFPMSDPSITPMTVIPGYDKTFEVNVTVPGLAGPFLMVVAHGGDAFCIGRVTWMGHDAMGPPVYLDYDCYRHTMFGYPCQAGAIFGIWSAPNSSTTASVMTASTTPTTTATTTTATATATLTTL
uniref:Uncharacterized protein n=1 Tax=Alexandrium monilatum TaxID=311494 RepID=A0A7S4T1Z1_9DINO